MEEWFKMYESDESNERRFQEMCDSMEIGTVLWYVALQNLLTVDYEHNCAMDNPKCGFGKWVETWYCRGEEGSTEHLSLVGESPKVYKPMKIVFNCKYESPHSLMKMYVFSKYGADSFDGKYLWFNTVWNDIKHPGCGLPRDLCASLSMLADIKGDSWSSNRRLEIMTHRPSRPLVFFRKGDCWNKCNELNKAYKGKSIYMLIKTLKNMTSEAKAFQKTYGG